MSVRLGSARTWRIALSALAVLFFAAAIPFSVLSHQVANLAIAAVIGLPSAAIGVLVTRRQPRNPLGWLFLVSATGQFIGTDGGGYAVLAYHLGHHLPLASVAVALDQIWGPSLVVFAVSILLFPDGRLPSQIWRWVFRVYCAAFATLLVATAVAIAGALAAHPVRVDENGGLAAVDYPVGWFNAVQFMILVLILGLSLSFIVRQALSWRRANGERRQQLKWLASGAFVSVICLIVAGPSVRRAIAMARRFWRARRPRVDGGHCAPAVDRRGDPALPAVRDRPDHLPDAGLRDRHRPADRGVRRARAAGHGGPAVQLTGGGRGLHPGGRRAVQPGPAPGAARRGPALQPGPVRRRADGERVRRPAAGRGGLRLRPRRRAGHRALRGVRGRAACRAARIAAVDRIARTGPVHRAAVRPSRGPAGAVRGPSAGHRG